MRMIVALLAAGSAVVATAAAARDGAIYLGGEFGAMMVDDTDVDIGAVENAITLNHEYGYDGGLFLGYDFGGFRIEAEAAHKKADLESYETVIRLPLEGPVFPPERDAGGGNTSVLSFMLNGMLDFGDDDGTSFFVGAGGGIARVKYDNLRNFANATPFLDESDSKKLAWQVFAGLRQAIGDNVDVTVKYRFFNVEDIEMVAFNGAGSDSRFRSHSVLGGITFNFGAPPPPPPVVAAPPPPPPPPRPAPPPPPAPPQVRCNQGPYIVFFDWDKSDITPEAATILNNAVTAYANCGAAAIMLAGHTDRSGSTAYNVGLAQRRNASTTTYLTGRGVPAARITSQAFGESMPRVPTADGVRELQNRRVEVTYGPGSGR